MDLLCWLNGAFSGVKFDKGGEWDGVVTEFTKNKSFTMSLKGVSRRSSDQTNYYLFEPTSKGTKMTITTGLQDE